MDIEAEQKNFVLNTIVSDIPAEFWTQLGDAARFAYGEAYAAIATDNALLPEQRQQKLYQERYFKMEYQLVTVARACAIPSSATLIGPNNCHFALAGKGRLQFTQSYVKTSGGMPTPATFRRQLAEAAEFQRAPRLDLGDEPSEFLLPKKVSGIILHSPQGTRLSEEEQSLGAIGFFVPYQDYKGWAVELTLSEINAAYSPVETREDRIIPLRKKPPKTGTEE